MKIEIRPATINDYTELVEMYKDLITVVYKGFEIGEDIFFYGTVQKWIEQKRDIIISETCKGEITGFTVSYIDDIGVIKPYYYGDIAFVKPQFRKGRSAYLLYNNVVKYAEKINLPLIAKAFVSEDNTDKVDKIQAKFGKPRFIEYHKGKDNE